MAQCRVVKGAAGAPPDYHILRADGAPFAKLCASDDGGRYVLQGEGVRLNFAGAFGRHHANVSDDWGRLLATTELMQGSALRGAAPGGGEYYRLRVVPAVDAGLVLLGLLCVDHAREA